MPTPKVTLTIPLTVHEHRDIRDAADKDGRTITNFMRTAALRAARGLNGVPINPPSGLPSAADLDKYAEEQKIRESTSVDGPFRKHWGY